jgi:hypothetical protein
MACASDRRPKEFSLVNVSTSTRPIALVLGLLTAFGLAGPVRDARADLFELSGTYVGTDHHANRYSGVLRGAAEPGGAFVGTFRNKVTDHGHLVGTQTYAFADGSTLTLEVDEHFDPTSGEWVGTYVITGGTGRFAGASGSGLASATPDPIDGNTGTIALSGTISF